MSVFDLLFPNGYNLNSNKLTTNELVSKLVDLVEARVDKLTGTEIISDKIQGTLGFNYLSPWDATKSYILNDLVVYNNQIWRCLVANTNVAPDPNNPAQAQWTVVTSNNAITNEKQFAQVNLNVGDDSKALVSPVPFKSIAAATNYIKTLGAGVIEVMTVGQNNIYAGLGLTSASNIIINGGDQNSTYLNNPQNISQDYTQITNCNNVIVKNLTIQGPNTAAQDIGQLINNKNLSFENVTFKDYSPLVPSNYIRIYNSVGNTWGSHSFLNCICEPSDTNNFTFQFSGDCDPGTVILYDSSGLVNRASVAFQFSAFGGVTTPANLTVIIKNSYFIGIGTYPSDMRVVFINCIIKGSIISTAAAGSLEFINCSFYDPSDDTWGLLQLSGTATYLLIDTLTNPNSTTDIIPVSPLNLTAGPASKFNRLATWSSGVATSTGTTQAIVPVLPGAILNNALGIVTYNGGTGAINFTVAGVYQLLIGMDIANTNTANEQCVLNYWCGINGSTEATALDTSSTDRGFVGSAGILATYPNSRRGLPLVVTITSPATSYFFYVRSLSAAAYNVTIQTMAVLQIR